MSCYSHILSGQSADLHGIQSQIYKVLKVLKVFFFVKMFNFANFDILLVLSQDNGMLNPCLLLSTS